MIKLYKSGKIQKEISQIFSCSQTNISSILLRRGFKFRDRKEVFKNQKYSDINKYFFRKIDSEQSAYFLGFLFADACVQTKK